MQSCGAPGAPGSSRTAFRFDGRHGFLVRVRRRCARFARLASRHVQHAVHAQPIYPEDGAPPPGLESFRHGVQGQRVREQPRVTRGVEEPHRGRGGSRTVHQPSSGRLFPNAAQRKAQGVFGKRASRAFRRACPFSLFRINRCLFPPPRFDPRPECDPRNAVTERGNAGNTDDRIASVKRSPAFRRSRGVPAVACGHGADVRFRAFKIPQPLLPKFKGLHFLTVN